MYALSFFPNGESAGYSGELPPHFHVGIWQRATSEVAVRMGALSATTILRQFGIYPIEDITLGVGRPVHAVSLGDPAELRRNHDIVNRWMVEKAGGTHVYPAHAGEGYRPHITPHDDLGRSAITRYTVDQLSLVTGDPKGIVRILRTYQLAK